MLQGEKTHIFLSFPCLYTVNYISTIVGKILLNLCVIFISGELIILLLFSSAFACSNSDGTAENLSVTHYRKLSKNAFVDVRIKNGRIVVNTAKSGK